MPSKSKAQARLMGAVAHNPEFAKKVGIPVSVGKEFNKADKGRKFREGGEMKKSFKEMEKKEVEFMKKKGAPKSMIKHEREEEMEEKAEGYKKGGRTKKFAKGGSTALTDKESKKIGDIVGKRMQATAPSLAAAAQRTPAAAPRPPMAPGAMGTAPAAPRPPMARPNMPAGRPPVAPGATPAPTMPMKKGGTAKAKGIHSIQKKSTGAAKVVKMASGGLASGHKSADGIAVRGKTRGAQPKMAGKKYC